MYLFGVQRHVNLGRSVYGHLLEVEGGSGDQQDILAHTDCLRTLWLTLDVMLDLKLKAIIASWHFEP